jgi:uncharacterized protein YigA (DUF484 family)
MSANPPLTIAALEQLLEEKRSRLEQLAKKREELQNQLAGLDRQMHKVTSLEGLQRRRRPGPPRVVNTAPLRVFVLAALKKHKKGLLPAEVAEKVLAAGYKSQAKAFLPVVYQCLYNTRAIKYDPSTGRYSAK